MANEITKEQQTLRNAAMKEILRGLRRELPPEEVLPDRMRKLIAQLEAKSETNNE